MSDTDHREPPTSDSHRSLLRLTALTLSILLVIAAIPIAYRAILRHVLIAELVQAIRNRNERYPETAISEVTTRIRQHNLEREAVLAVLPMLSSGDYGLQLHTLMSIHDLDHATPEVISTLVATWENQKFAPETRIDAAFVLMEIDPDSAARYGATEALAAAQSERKRTEQSKSQSHPVP